ncbi:type I restriction enzyme endonuclease domain-containing protein [Acidithiobacillus sp. M4-SHS-6]|uniref:type I restriction enzyme endonuclease domain-containing protein n=1 Tax=Acidithiobacillus sp. M4-SHS-6 TaxID=3383024 RepID=UPI0039BDD55D
MEHHAIALFRELGYSYAHGLDIGPDGHHPERADYGETLLLDRLRTAIHQFNPTVPKDIREEALRQVQAVGAAGALLTQNLALQQMLVEGVRIATQVDGEERGVIVRLLDDEHPEQNDFLVVNQYTVVHNRINRRADLVVFVNGMPLGLFELKNMADANATVQKAWNQLQTYQADIPNLMAYNAVLVISDGLIALAKALQSLDARHAALGLSKEEVAFYDALATNDSAVQAMGDDALKMIAKEVADTVRQNTRIDWSIREQARAHLRRMVKRVLLKHGYPPDMQEGAVNLVIAQAEGLVG